MTCRTRMVFPLKCSGRWIAKSSRTSCLSRHQFNSQFSRQRRFLWLLRLQSHRQEAAILLSGVGPLLVHLEGAPVLDQER